MQIDQLRSNDGTGTLSYLLSDGTIAILIDPNYTDVESITAKVNSSGLRLTHVIDTHTHADHISGAGELRARFGAAIVMHENTKHKWKVVDLGDKFGIGDTLRANARIPVDIYVDDGDEIVAGAMRLIVLFTPGHTDNHISLLAGENLFTGDLLLIGQAGRSDLPGGDPEQQYDSLVNKILPLPDSTRIYPGHDYADNEFALLGNEKRTNPFLSKRSKDEYIRFVEEFFPPLSESAEGGKVTLQCGVQRVQQATDTFTSISCSELKAMLDNGFNGMLLDVREPIELASLGAIDGVKNISVRHLTQRTRELPIDKATPIVTICASGSRSVEAAHFLQQLGYKNVMNLTGGILRWIESGHPIQKPATLRS